jgi:hypothetical protein
VRINKQKILITKRLSVSSASLSRKFKFSGRTRLAIRENAAGLFIGNAPDILPQLINIDSFDGRETFFKAHVSSAMLCRDANLAANDRIECFEFFGAK